ASYVGFVLSDGPANLTKPVVLTTSALASSPVGTYPITASGATSPNYTTTFVPGALSIQPAATTMTYAGPTGPVIVGRPVTVSVIVAPVSPGAGTPSGPVRFFDGLTPIGTGTIEGGRASLYISDGMRLGTRALAFSYAGDGSFLGSSTLASVPVTTIATK